MRDRLGELTKGCDEFERQIQTLRVRDQSCRSD